MQNKIFNDDHLRFPINVTSSNVINGGASLEVNKKIQVYESEFPILTTAFNEKNQENLTGHVVGKLTVIGRAKEKKGWVVRCVCGTYAIRQSKAIKNKENFFDCCEVCRHRLFLRREDVRRQTGKNVEMRDLWH